MKPFRPQRADSIGIILHYECTYRCAHCLYACRPGLGERIRDENLDPLVAAIRDACPEASLHIRTWLYHHFPGEKRPAELAPGSFYEEMGRLFCVSNSDSDSANQG